MIARAQRSPTGWLLLFIAFGVAGALVGLLVSWASGWPALVAIVIGSVIGLLIASRAVAKPTGDISVVPATMDLSHVRTDRIGLRHFTTADAASGALAATIDDEVSTSMGWSAAEADAVTVMGDDPALLASRGFLAIFDLQVDRIDGVVSLTHTSGPTRRRPAVAEGRLGIWLGAGARGRGIGAEAVALAIRLSWQVGLDSLTMGTTASNIAMRRCFIASGAELFDTTPHLLPDGRTEDSVWYRIDHSSA